MNNILRSFFMLSALSVFLLIASACAQSAPTQAAPDPVQGKVGTQLLINTYLGYSLEYPSNYDVAQYSENGLALVVGSLLNTEQPRADILVLPANGITAEQAADQFITGYPGFELARTTITVSGETAVVLDQVPGQDFNRVVFIVHADRLYQLRFSPADQNLGEVYMQMEALYNTVILTFKFDPLP